MFNWDYRINIIVLSLLHGGFLFGQTIEYNQLILLHNQATIFRNINIYEDSLILTGEIGADSTGLQSVFVLTIDTVGNLGEIWFIKDPEKIEHILLNGSSPVIYRNQELIFSGEFLWESDNYFVKYNKSTRELNFSEYEAPFLVRFTESLLEYNDAFYVVGYIQTEDFDVDVFLQKIDSTGNKLWEKTYGIPSRDETGRAAIIEDDGLTIMVSESFDDTPTVKNDTRYWIRFMHVDTSGAIVKDWREEVTGEEGWSGTLLKYNNDYIYSTNQIGEETNFGPLVASQIVRRDQDFNLVWRKPFGEADNHHNQIGDMIFSRDSTTLLASGNIWDATQEFTWARVMMVDLCGDLTCEVRDTGIYIPGLGSSNRLEGIVQSESGSIYTVGYTYRSSGFYEGLLLKINMDGCVDTLCTITDIEDHIRLQEDLVLLYPNPVRSTLQIRISEEVSLPVMISVHDVHGRQVHKTWIHQHSASVDLSGLVTGPYYVVTEKNGSIIHAQTIVKLE